MNRPSKKDQQAKPVLPSENVTVPEDFTTLAEATIAPTTPGQDEEIAPTTPAQDEEGLTATSSQEEEISIPEESVSSQEEEISIPEEPSVTPTPKEKNKNGVENDLLDSYIKEAQAVPIEQVVPEMAPNKVSRDDTMKIFETLANSFDVSTRFVIIAVYMLMLKGAANNGTPLTLSVTINKTTTITKGDLMYAYQRVTGNRFLRRFAEALAVNIGVYAETYGLRGELATRLDRMARIQDGTGLNSKELAWASSFSQNVPNLSALASDRLVRLLAEDYNKRFEKVSSSKNKEGKNKDSKPGPKGTGSLRKPRTTLKPRTPGQGNQDLHSQPS